MWGGSEINFFEPLLIGMEITRVITLESINYKKGKSGRLCIIEIKNELKITMNTSDRRQASYISLP